MADDSRIPSPAQMRGALLLRTAERTGDMRTLSGLRLTKAFRESWADSIAWQIADEERLHGALARRTCGIGVVGHPIGPRWVTSCRRVAFHSMVDVAGVSKSSAGRMLNITPVGVNRALARHAWLHDHFDENLLTDNECREVAMCDEWMPIFQQVMWESIMEWIEATGDPVIPDGPFERLAKMDAA